MKTQKHSIYIIGNNPSKVGALRQFLVNMFKNKANIYLYFSSKSFLRVLHGHVDLVILDHLSEKGSNPEQGPEILKSIKARYPKTEIIIHTSNDDTALAVESIRSGANEYIVEHNRSWLKIGILTDKVIAQPLKRLYAEWGVMKFTGMLIIVCFVMAVLVGIALKITHYI